MLIRTFHRSHRVACWCAVSGLTAVPAPRSHASNPPAILLSYPLAPASAPSSSSSSSPVPPDITFTLNLPDAPLLPLGLASTAPHSQASLPSASSSYITHLSFSSDGDLLMAVSATHPPTIDACFLTTATRSQPSIRLTLFRKLDCINTWECIADWDADRARAATGGLSVGKVVDARWLGGADGTGSRDLLASHGGNTFVAVLDTQEVGLPSLLLSLSQPVTRFKLTLCSRAILFYSASFSISLRQTRRPQSSSPPSRLHQPTCSTSTSPGRPLLLR